MMVRMRTAAEHLADHLVKARLAARPLAGFPGQVPETLEDAYAVQQAAIERWPDEIAGWKVGRLSPDLAARFGAERFLGPVFRAAVVEAKPDGTADFAMFVGGSAAFEAEFVVHVTENAAGNPVAGSLSIGVEIASSPISSLLQLGSLAMIADLGNNAGLILGPDIPVALLRSCEPLGCATIVDEGAEISATTEALPGGIAGAFRFAVSEAERLGRPLRAGQFVTTGAVTGMHVVLPGQQAMARFEPGGTLTCRITARSVLSLQGAS